MHPTKERPPVDEQRPRNGRNLTRPVTTPPQDVPVILTQEIRDLYESFTRHHRPTRDFGIDQDDTPNILPRDRSVTYEPSSRVDDDGWTRQPITSMNPNSVYYSSSAPLQSRTMGHSDAYYISPPRPTQPQPKSDFDRITEYNSELGCNNSIDRVEVALKTALKLSRKEAESNPNMVLNMFITAFVEQRWSEALSIYERAQKKTPEAVDLINSHLDKIPWRVSCEYYYDNGKIHWVNSWIKVGWWKPEVHEISPQLKNGSWVKHGDPIPAHSIDTEKFYSVVWKGMSKEMNLHIIEAKALAEESKLPIQQTNVELELRDGFWVPIDIAFKDVKNKSNVLDLTRIEIGSLKEPLMNDLDTLRIPVKMVVLKDGTEVSYFQGSTLGSALNTNIIDFDLYSEEEIENDLDSTEVEFYYSDAEADENEEDDVAEDGNDSP